MVRPTTSNAIAASAIVIALLGQAPAALRAQQPDERLSLRERPRADSSAVLHRARQEQARFERVRRDNLPWTWASGRGPCDERIGRFCLTYGDGDESSWEPPEEGDEVVAAREHLIARLGEAKRLQPGDAWIAGQHVRYLLEAERFDGAIAAAAECRAEPWWCAALSGYAHHYANRPAAADSAFTAALGSMSEERRREWLDPEILLDGRSLKRYRGMDAAERERFAYRFWSLARPLLSMPGNAIRSEHLSRHVINRLQDRAQSPERLSWGDDLRELLLRYGWPSGWERVRQPPTSLGPPPLVAHFESTPLNMLPPDEPLNEEWQAERTRQRTDYPLPQLEWFRELPHQVAAFRREERAIIVAAYELHADSVPQDTRVEAALALQTQGIGPVMLTPIENASAVGRASAEALSGEMLFSLEVRLPEAARIARARYGLTVPALHPSVMAVSDLLLLVVTDELPDSLAAAAKLARGSTRIGVGEPIGVFWEVYGPAVREESLSMTLRLLHSDRSLLRRLSDWIGITRDVPPVRLRWGERSSSSILPRSLRIDVPDLSPGDYTLELTVEAPGREPMTARRDLQIVQEPANPASASANR